MVHKPARISTTGTGDAPRRTFRELSEITQAVEYSSIQRGSTLSADIRAHLRETLAEDGWDVDALLSGNPEAVDAAWTLRTGSGRPERVPRPSVASSRVIDPGDTIETF